jgi:DNA-binding transcriptional regulator YbjK
MASNPRVPTARRNRSDEILQAAIEIFHQKGYAAASIQDVADTVGVLKGSLYHYIDSKEDLLARIFEGSGLARSRAPPSTGCASSPAAGRSGTCRTPSGRASTSTSGNT